MTTRYTVRLVTPPEEEEVYPYRRVWRSLIIEIVVLLAIALVIVAVFSLFDPQLAVAVRHGLLLALALLPLGLWSLASLLQERFVPEPRQRLLVIIIVTMLAANAVGVPLVEEFLQIDRWLPQGTAVDRIIGYTFTFGITHTLIKYLIIYYAAARDHFRVRIDSVAYAVGSAVGYATILNLHYVASNSSAPLDVAMLRMVDTLLLQLMTSFVIGYGMAQVTFGQPTPLLLTLTLLLSASLTGVVIALRAGLVNANLFLGTSQTNPILGTLLVAAGTVATAFIIGYLIENADRIDREAAASREL